MLYDEQKQSCANIVFPWLLRSPTSKEHVLRADHVVRSVNSDAVFRHITALEALSLTPPLHVHCLHLHAITRCVRRVWRREFQRQFKIVVAGPALSGLSSITDWFAKVRLCVCLAVYLACCWCWLIDL